MHGKPVLLYTLCIRGEQSMLLQLGHTESAAEILVSTVDKANIPLLDL